MTRYSPNPIDAYPSAAVYRLLRSDPAAWDLAWLSWDFENPRRMPDPALSVKIRRTLQFVISDGSLDLTGAVPDHLKVRGLMKYPAPYVAKFLVGMKRLRSLPMFRAYGSKWVETIEDRSHLYREPHDAVFDFAVPDTSQAADALTRIGAL